MIVKLTYTDRLPVPVELRSNMGDQPLQPGQELQMTFELHEGEHGFADLVLICQPGDSHVQA